jgi:feruloyl esterase
MTVRLRHLTSIAMLGLLPGLASAAADPCVALLGMNVPGMNLTLTQAQRVAAGPLQAAPGEPRGPGATLPEHCRVEGVIDARTGVDGKPYGIGFALALPTVWNGRFLFQGGGGLNGSIRPPVGGVAAGDTPALARGFAVVSTDSGHKGAGFDASFMADQEALLNFLYQSTDKVTQAAKQLVALHYGRRPDRSYFAGCSTGGREAMIQTQRFPKAFDGVIAGAPAMRTNYSNIGVRWVATQLNTVAPAGPMPEAKKAPSSPASTVRTVTAPGGIWALPPPSERTRVGLSGSMTVARVLSEARAGTETTRLARPS